MAPWLLILGSAAAGVAAGTAHKVFPGVHLLPSLLGYASGFLTAAAIFWKRS